MIEVARGRLPPVANFPRIRALRGAANFVGGDYAGSKDGPGYNVPVGSEKTLRRVLTGASDAAIRFDDLCSLLERLGFDKRVKGSHHVFRKAGVEEKINLQRDGNNAKPYQVRQVRAVILKYKLGDAE